MGNSEVGDFDDATSADEQVGGFDVTVDNTLGVDWQKLALGHAESEVTHGIRDPVSCL